jgi:hypothetical protein
MSAILGIKLGKNAVDTWNEKDFRIDTEHTEIYKVLMTTGVGLTGQLWEAAQENLVANVAGLPRIGTDSVILPGAFCIKRSFQEVGPATWEVECTYSNIQKRGDDSDVNNNPWDIDPEWTWGYENMEVPMTADAQDSTRGITNSAGEPLPPVTKPIAITVLTIRRAELSFDDSIIDTYVNHVNSSTYWGRAAGKALMAGITAQTAKRDYTKYFNVEYTIKFSPLPEGWAFEPLDEGTYYWQGGVGTGRKVPFGDDAFQQVVGNLNGSGGKNSNPLTPSFVSPPYNRYDEVNFNALNLGPFTWA